MAWKYLADQISGDGEGLNVFKSKNFVIEFEQNSPSLGTYTLYSHIGRGIVSKCIGFGQNTFGGNLRITIDGVVYGSFAQVAGSSGNPVCGFVTKDWLIGSARDTTSYYAYPYVITGVGTSGIAYNSHLLDGWNPAVTQSALRVADGPLAYEESMLIELVMTSSSAYPRVSIAGVMEV